MPHKDLAVRKAYHKKFNDGNKARKNQLAKEYRQRNLDKIAEYKETHPCVMCGESDIICLVFHHKDSDTKAFNISRNTGRFGWDKLYAEIIKCDVLCANCHLKVHALDKSPFTKRQL